MPDSKRSFVLSFFVGGLIGSGITLLLAQHLSRKQNAQARARRMRVLRDESKERLYEDGIYCAPEGADMHYDLEDDVYYYNGER